MATLSTASGGIPRKKEKPIASSKKASEAGKTMRDPKASHEQKSKAASEMSKSKETGTKKK